MRLLGLILVVVLVGCGNGAPSCKDALDKAARTLGDGASPITREMTAVCERSGWTAEQRSCVANAQDKKAVATCLASAVISTATKARNESRAVGKAVQAEQEARKQAQEALDRAQDQLDQLAKDLADFDGRLRAADTELMHARNDAERAAARAGFEALNREKIELDARLAAAKAAAKAAHRANGVQP
jgi:predicted  nucleic acid-binding Zn-ribbon protein